MIRRSLAALVLVGSLFTSFAGAEGPQLPEEIRNLMQDRDYPAAIEAIDAELAKKDAPADYLTYLKGRALHFQKKYDEAAKVLDQVQAKYPDSPWARRARFAKGAAMARKGDFNAAEQIYQAEAKHLLSGERKGQLAELLIEFADGYFKPADENQKPDYARALLFYNQALEIGPLPERRAEVELQIAQCYQNNGAFDEAAKRYAAFVKDRADSPLELEARYRLGWCQLQQGQHAAARRTWQDLDARHKDSPSPRIAEAAYRISLTYGVPQPGSSENLNLGVAALRAFIERFPNHKLASEAYLRIAQSYLHRGQHENAVAALRAFLADERYADRTETPEARYLLGGAYQAQKKFAEALTAWREYLVKHPTHSRWSEAQRAIIDTEHLTAAEAHNAKKYDEAGKLWDAFLVKYPLDARAPQILFNKGQMNYDQKKWDAAIADWRRLVSKYPGTEPASRGQLMIGAVLEVQQAKFAEAIEEYKKVAWGSQVAAAKRHIARLTAKQMAIATERVFRTNEPAQVDLTARNIEEVAVSVYTIDLETYFRKMHLASGVEGLDLDLIDPDETFTYKLPDYAKHKELRRTIDLPLPKKKGEAGVMAVVVATKSLEATTLVLRSDLDIIAKSSRDEVFVFAQNMVTGKPWPKARLLISNGQQVFAEATTGDDGVFQQSYEELKDADDVRIFAVAEGSVASNVVGLSGVGVAQGLSDKGYIYTDRSAYRAGQLVHVRGVLRRVAGDTYQVEEGSQWKVSVYDPRSRLLWQDDVALNAFGSFHCHFGLPAGSPQGEYRIQVQDREGRRAYQGGFVVHEYSLPTVRIEVDTPRRVYYRGEKIEGVIKASFYYGAPLVDREIRYQFAGGRTITVRTDKQGAAKFLLDTEEYRETQVLPLVVTLSDPGLQSSTHFVLATHGYSLSLETVRPVYLAGETFETTVRATDAEGKPAARKLKLNVLERTLVEGRRGERPVESHDLATDEKTGEARVTLKLPEGGHYILRAEGIDRFKNPITGQHNVQVSGDDDRVRLRILAERHTYKAGDEAKITLHWREQPALALVTFQGAKVLDYRLVKLQTGVNELPIAMTAELAPNFELGVAVMTDARRAKDADPKEPVRRYHTASSPFQVERELLVKVETRRAADAKGPIRPGEQLDVVITTTDPQGKPVAAEVSLAMVEQALMDRFPRRVSAIDDFFRGAARQAAVRTTASVVFAYRPTTLPINPRLLAESDRLETEEEEQRLLALLGEEWRGAGQRFRSEVAVQLNVSSNGSLDQLRMPTGAAHLDSLTTAGVQLDNLTAAQQTQLRAQLEDLPPEQRQAVVQYFGRLSRSDNDEQNGEGQQLLNRSDYVDGVIRGRIDVSASERGVWDTMHSVDRAAVPFDDAYRWKMQVTEHDGKRLTELARNYWAGDVGVIQRDGGWYYTNLGDMDKDEAEKTAQQLAAAGGLLLPGLAPQETGYWNPSITTGDKGTATVQVTLPERSTAWSLHAKGISTASLAGEANANLVAKKDLFGELKLPLALTDGDDARIVCTVHNTAIKAGKITVTLKTTIGEKSVVETKTVDAGAGAMQPLEFAAKIAQPAGQPAGASGPDTAATFELTVSSGDARDTVRRTVPVQPYGVRVFRTASGAAQGDTTAWVELPAEMPVANPSLQIVVGPTVEQSLLDVVLGAAPWCQIETNRFASGLESSTSDLMASLALLELLGATRDAGNPQAQTLDARVRSAVGQLIAAQADDGSWGLSNRGGVSRYMTARALWSLGLARKAGFPVQDEAYHKAINYLKSENTKLSNDDYESKAVLLHALATADAGDFALANRLYRSRPSLSTSALIHLALALIEMDRKSLADDLLTVVAERKLDEAAPKRRSAQSSLPWNHAGVEQRALLAIAVERIHPGSAQLKELVAWLEGHRTGHRWSPDKATGPATLALARFYAKSRFEGEKYTLNLFVNNNRVEQIEVQADAATQTIEVPAKFLNKGKQTVRFELAGRGRYTYQVILGGFVNADRLKSTARDWRVERHYQPAPLEVDGKPIPRGFGVVEGSYTSFRNPLTQLPVGRRGQVRLEVYRDNVPSRTPEEHLEYLVITEPLPSGATVVESSVTGGFDRFEIRPGEITFFVGNRRYIGAIEYELHGFLPGVYRAAPTVVRDAYRPDDIAVYQPKTLTILPLGGESEDKYRLTPQELYALGTLHFDKGEMKEASKHLTELVAKWNLEPAPYQKSIEMLLDAHLAIGPHNKVVDYFEIIKERWPQLEIPYDKILKVGASYHEMGEYERAHRIFRATVESSFMRESRLAGFLQTQGEFLRSVEVMGDLLREYPPEPFVATATYSLAQQVYAKAPEVATDPKLKAKKLTRVALIKQAHDMLEGFLTAWPEDPAADQASFSAAGALLELEQYEPAIAACNRYAKRYPESQYLDSYWYTIGYCHFARGEHAEALAMCRKVAEAKRKDPQTGRMVESTNHYRAIYILGQIYHSLGQAAEAIAEYTRVKDRFADAQAAIDYFARQAIALPEITTVRPGKASTVELAFRNVAQCDTTVYRIDLMKFSLLKRDLSGITAINLAGIRPLHQATTKLGDGKDYRDRTHKLELPLKEEGAYLVVCRGDGLHASGLVLVSPLEVQVQEEADSGEVRTTVKDVTEGKFVHDVHVKVIGSANDDFLAGETDLRGVFVANDIRGTSTVIAQADGGRYAFFRGESYLGPQPQIANERARESQSEAPADETPNSGKSGKGELLEGLFKGNRDIQKRQGQYLDELYRNKEQGVKVEAAL